MPVSDVLPEIAVLCGAVGSLLAASWLTQSQQGWCAGIALAGIAAAVVLTALQLGELPRLTFSGTWALDGTAAWGKLLILCAAALSVLLSPEWFRRDRRHGEYYTVLLFATLGAMIMAGAADIMQLVLGILLASVAGYTLAAYHRASALSVEAGMKFFLIGALTNSLLLIGVVLVFGLAGGTGYDAIAAAPAAGGDTAWTLAFVLILVGIAFKLAAVPAHAWLPDVAQGAPAPGAAFLTVVPKIGAAVALARIAPIAGEHVAAWRELVAAVAVATMTLGNLAALWQDDMRRLIGWSSVSQSGYAIVAIALIGLTEQALPALIFFLGAYAAANMATFAVVVELRGRTALSDYRGLATARPLALIVMMSAFLSLVGIPPLAGFVGKLLLLTAAVDGGYAWLALVVIANTVLSLFYYLRILAPACFGRPALPVAVLGRWAMMAMLISGAFVIILGPAAELLLGGFGDLVLVPTARP
jgi:NADH-quinone oxidoreductase subunit N